MRALVFLLVAQMTSCRSPASPVQTPADEQGAETAPVEDQGPGSDQDAGVSQDEPDEQGSGVQIALDVNVPESGGLSPDPADVEAELTMHRRVSWGYGCGGKCASNQSGSSAVTILCMKDGTARLSDAGELTYTMSYPDGSSSQKTSWSQAWTGDCERQASAMVLELERQVNVCVVVSETSGGEKSKEKCHKSTGKILVGCKLALVDVVVADALPGEKPEIEKLEAWTCKPDKEGVDPGGTPAPWVFGEGSCIDTWYVGEPDPQTLLRPCE